ncbi:MAG: glutamate-5-semialdehyde dehydrogenase, partial [Sporomusa sp.]
MDYITELAEKGVVARQAARQLATLSTAVKNKALYAMADALQQNQAVIVAANAEDISRAEAGGMPKPLLDRLLLNEARIKDMAEGLRQIAALPDPVGHVVAGWTRPNGLAITKVQVPLGVIGIIYEARPNVTVDAAGLCL